MRVAVLKGGRSLERAVSLQSGARVEEAVTALGHDVVAIDADERLVSRLKEEDPDVAFIALHGPGGEGGTVQSLLELLGIPYTGPGIGASVLCMDKVQAKHRMRAVGIPTPDWVAFGATAFRELGAADAFEEIEAGFGLPLVVKPAGQGSALGVRFAGDAGAVPAAIVGALSYDDRVLIERYVAGRELAVSILAGEPLPIVEAIPEQADLFNYEARYEIGRTRYVCPAVLEDAEADAVTAVALRTWEALGCAGFARVDVMLGGEGVGPQVLEVNSVPGLTDTSLLPIAAEAAGISFESFVERAIELALGE
jgi:D-alanine-D-alanine ligase